VKHIPSKIVWLELDTPVQTPNKSFAVQFARNAFFIAVKAVGGITNSVVPLSTIAPPLL